VDIPPAPRHRELTLTVILRNERNFKDVKTYDSWVTINEKQSDLPVSQKCADLTLLLENAHQEISENWLILGNNLSQEKSAILAHSPTCAGNISDLGLMLAWTHLVKQWAKIETRILVICNDPWLFRHLQDIEGVVPGEAPRLWLPKLKLRVRGYLARTKYAFVSFFNALLLRKFSRCIESQQIYLLVYGHPASTPEEYDGYFGDLMTQLPNLKRVLHVDCSRKRAQELSADEKTVSLHAWGNPFFAFTLIYAGWKSQSSNWLVRRAVIQESGSGQAATIKWQNHCQTRWLRQTQPRAIAWPWENHSWERELVRATKSYGVHTIGYQHSVIGRTMLNYSCKTNADGCKSVPDQIVCTGEIWRELLCQWGLPKQRVSVGGALRIRNQNLPKYDPDAPLLVALPFDKKIAKEMVDAVSNTKYLGDSINFLVKDHPMSPVDFTESIKVKRTILSFSEHVGLSGVIYAATTVGLESILQGIPTLRFIPSSKIAMDIVPENIVVPIVNAENMAENIRDLVAHPPLDRSNIFAEQDFGFWRTSLNTR
jgi:hypothetical protein